jgi:dihydroneopterin aldolase/2-amino-4-hydroxy-6-hydroxymethyldihydropteridine diphosphokinase
MDRINIKNLEVFANHGVFTEETQLGQKFLVSLTLHMNTRCAGKSDELLQSVHYGEVSHFAVRFLKEHTYKLIEAAAEHLAEAVLLRFDLVERVTVEIKKPWAPIGLPLEYVSVEITRSWHTVYLSFGSNMGDKEAYIHQGIEELSAFEDCKVEEISTFFITKPYGMTEQDDFVNGCLKLKTLCTPKELLDRLHEIEQHADRKRIIHWGPRTLDLDILFYDEELVQTKELTIPHADMIHRGFVLEPLCEIAPYLVHPVCHKTVSRLFQEWKEKS